jgi:hypothetical protein
MKPIHFLLLLLLTVPCKSQENNLITTFNLKELPKITTVRLSDLGFVDIEYIPLETNEQCMIKNINEIKIGDDFFLVKFSSTILKFKENGSFVTKIGIIGRGPNEFTVAHDVDIDNKNQNIYLVSAWQKKFNVYSESGEFLRTFHCPLNTTNFKVTGDGILCYNMNTMGNVETSYNLIDTEGRVIKNFPNKYRWHYKQQVMLGFVYENLFYRYNNKLFKKELYSDTVYVYENLDFKPHLVIELGKRLVTPKVRSDFSPEYIRDNFISPWNLFEFGDYVYFEFLFSRNSLVEDLSFIGSKRKDFHALVDPTQGFINDLDGGPNIWPKTIKDDNTIICWVDAFQLKAHVASESFKNSKPKYPEKKKELEKLANSLKETDNPVLMMVRLKK